MAEPQMCLGCNKNPATTSDKTVPLCANCARMISDSRGVAFEKKAELKN